MCSFLDLQGLFSAYREKSWKSLLFFIKLKVGLEFHDRPPQNRNQGLPTLCTGRLTTALFLTAKGWKQPECQQIRRWAELVCVYNGVSGSCKKGYDCDVCYHSDNLPKFCARVQLDDSMDKGACSTSLPAEVTFLEPIRWKEGSLQSYPLTSTCHLPHTNDVYIKQSFKMKCINNSFYVKCPA